MSNPKLKGKTLSLRNRNIPIQYRSSYVKDSDSAKIASLEGHQKWISMRVQRSFQNSKKNNLMRGPNAILKETSNLKRGL